MAIVRRMPVRLATARDVPGNGLSDLLSLHGADDVPLHLSAFRQCSHLTCAAVASVAVWSMWRQ